MTAEPRLLDSSLYTQLAAASLGERRVFADSVLRLLCKELRLGAASFYTYTAETESLRLRAQVGFDYARYADFQLGLDSFPGIAIRTGRVIHEPDPGSSELYRDKALLDGRQAHGGLIAAPLHGVASGDTPLQPSSAPIAALCLYPDSESEVQSIIAWLTEEAAFIGRLYHAVLEHHTVRFRQQVVEGVAFRNDIGSLAYNFLELMCQELEAEAGSLWILDGRRNQLYLRGSTALRDNRRLRDVRPIRLGSSSLIAKVFSSRTPLFHSPGHPTFRPERVLEKLQTPLTNGAMFPIALPDQARLRGERRPAGAAGVLTLLNHSTTLEGVSHPTAFNMEDRLVAEFGCEMLGVLTYQLLRTRDHESDFERLLHGARTNLQAARSSLQFLERLDLSNKLPRSQQYYIPNAIDWIEDLEAQIERDELSGQITIDTEAISLYGDVLAKIEPMIRRIATRTMIDNFSVRGTDILAQSYRQLPRVKGNRRALNCVFRNLVDNSIKSRRHDDSVVPEIALAASASEGRDLVTVRVEDNGIGIDAEDLPYIFDDGFRGKRASGRQPQGVGRGLYECRLILSLIEGSIEAVPLERYDRGTAFEVALKVDAS